MRTLLSVFLCVAHLITVAGVKAQVKLEEYETYDRVIDPRAARLWLPRDVPVVRGLVIMANAAGGDSREWPREWSHASYIALARSLDFGMIGTTRFTNNVAAVEGPFLMELIELAARSAGRPELRNVPFICTGFSAGGQFAYEFNAWKPERTLAFNVDKGGNYRTYEVSQAALRTPGILVAGADDTAVRRTNITRLFDTNRPRGARWALVMQYAYAHAPGGTQHLFVPFFARVIAHRYPANLDPREGPVALRDYEEADGWLADHETWTSGFTHISSHRDFRGEHAKASWLPDQDMAYLYRAFSSYIPSDAIVPIEIRRQNAYPLQIQEPASNAQRFVRAGDAFTVQLDWKEWEGEHALVFAGASKVAELVRGAAAAEIALAPGHYGITVQSTDRRGRVGVTKPLHVEVQARRPAAEAHGADLSR